MGRPRGNGRGAALRSATVVGEYRGLKVRVNPDGTWTAIGDEQAEIASAADYKALQSEVDKALKTEVRETFGEPDVVVVENGQYHSSERTLHVGKLVGLSQANRLVLKVGGKRVTVKESAWVFRASDGLAEELGAALARVKKAREAVDAAEGALREALEDGHEYREYYSRTRGRAALIEELKDALA